MKRVRRTMLIGALLGVVAVLIGRVYAVWQARDQIYTVEDVPPRPVAIIFGAQVHENGRLSSMLADRVHVGADLYHAGKVHVLLMTGAHRTDIENEPEAMRQYALSLGVPDEAIVLDYAGFRTYDSCYRARDIFQVDQAILVTQAYHLGRALLICNQLGVDAVGVAADVARPQGYGSYPMIFGELREFPATTLSYA